MATLIGLLCHYEREGNKNWKKETKISGGQRRANKEDREWAGDRGAAED